MLVGPSLFTDSITGIKDRFLKMCVCFAGMAVRLNMSLASLCSHVHKSTYNDCKPKKHIALRNPPLLASRRTFSSKPAGGAAVGSSMHADAHRHKIMSVMILMHNKQYVCWWAAAVGIKKSCRLSAVLLWRNGGRKNKCWNNLSHLSHIRPDVREKQSNERQHAGCLVIKN